MEMWHAFQVAFYSCITVYQSPIRALVKVVHYKGNRVPFGTCSSVGRMDVILCQNVEFQHLTQCMLSLCLCVGECKDTTHYCAVVKRLKLCPIDMYKQRCCESCLQEDGST